jgi:hypothetical protein
MFRSIFTVITLVLSVSAVWAQPAKTPRVQMLLDDSTPAVVQHLPDWQNARNRAVYITNADGLRSALGDRAVFDLVNFEGGTEAAAAVYPQGKLLIVEYGTPQFSIDGDNKFRERLAAQPDPPVYYKREGNYSVFVFDAKDAAAANALLDQIKYEKTIVWQSHDESILIRAERAYLERTSEVFVATLVAVVLGLGLAVCAGAALGAIIFYSRKRRRTAEQSFSDAGGMIRLNLDELTDNVGLLNE